MIRFTKTVAFAVGALVWVSSAFALDVDVFPREVLPGDAFMVKVSGIDSSQVISVSVAGTVIPLEQCGDGCRCGIGAVGIDTAPGSAAVTIRAGQEQLTTGISVGTPKFPEISLKLPEGKVNLSPEDLARARKEEERLGEIWTRNNPPLYHGDFILPLQNPVSTVFGARRVINGTMVSVHRGIDLRGKRGEAIRAANYGRVVLAQELFFGGNTLIIDHGSGIYTVYMHLEKFTVSIGDPVTKGEIIGLVGSSGRATGPHLHFGVKILAVNANPLSLMNLKIDQE